MPSPVDGAGADFFAQDAKPMVMAARAMMERIRILECHPLLCRLHVAGM